MSRAIKVDGYAANGDYGFLSIRVWFTGAVTIEDWAAILVNDVTNPAAVEGWSFTTADADSVGADYDTIGVIMETLTAAGFANVQIRGRRTGVNVATAAAIGTPLAISATAGRAEEATTQAGSFRILGRVLAEEAGDRATVWLYPHPAFV